MDDLLADFLIETTESLAALDAALLELERTPDDAATLSLIFRIVHTIKGTCGFLGLARLERLAHATENVLGAVRDGALAVTSDLVSAILAAFDRIGVILATLAANGAEPAGDDAALIRALARASDGLAGGAATTEPDGAGAGRPDQPANPTPGAGPSPPTGGRTIRVGVEVLEGMMSLVSELVLTRNQLMQIARAHQDTELAPALQRLSRVTADLRDGVLKARMQPIGRAWDKLPRIVRDLACELGKKIDLVILGAATELDRQVLELIRDPLTHMVRNSADHGLETPEERRAAGKAETGRITLSARHEGGRIVIEVADDGRGLPTWTIRAKALALGLATDAELASMSAAQIDAFIFRAGFSTALEVTPLSGRGVGLDVVKTNIVRIGGEVDVTSAPGHGTTFTVAIPLTLTVVSAVIVEASGGRFAVPRINVRELVRISGGRGADGPVLEWIADGPVLWLRERRVALVSLRALLALEGRAAADTGAEAGAPGDEAPTIVVTQAGATEIGVIVDRVLDTEDVVVKPMAPILRDITMFGGNAILGDGSVAMILDPIGIARAGGIAVDPAGRPRAGPDAAPARIGRTSG